MSMRQGCDTMQPGAPLSSPNMITGTPVLRTACGASQMYYLEAALGAEVRLNAKRFPCSSGMTPVTLNLDLDTEPQ